MSRRALRAALIGGILPVARGVLMVATGTDDIVVVLLSSGAGAVAAAAVAYVVVRVWERGMREGERA